MVSPPYISIIITVESRENIITQANSQVVFWEWYTAVGYKYTKYVFLSVTKKVTTRQLRWQEHFLFTTIRSRDV